MNANYNQLFQPFTFKNGITIKNRVVMAPMTTWASNDDLTVSDEEVSYYRKRVNGVGLVITGCTQVTANGQGFTNEFAAYDDCFIPSLRKLADAAKSGGAPALLQIFHAGNKALPDLDVVSPSAMKTEATDFAPSVETRELSHEEILSLIHAFGETTRRAIEAGFDGIEIHGAHGFLIQNFWSEVTNQRIDEWGGTLENRLRFPTAVIEEIKSVIKKYAQNPFIVGFRLSPDFLYSEESSEGGLRTKDTYELLERLVQLDVDYIHASLHDVSAKPTNSEDNKTKLELILEKVNGRVPVMAAGAVKTPDDALKVVEKGLPLIAIGHALVMDPEWVQKAESGREAEIDTELKVSKLSQLELPQKLWNVMEAMPGWFTINREEEQVK